MGKYNNVVTEESLKKKKKKHEYEEVRAEGKRRALRKKAAEAKKRKNVSKEVNSKTTEFAKFNKSRASEGLLTGGWGKDKGSGSNKNTKNDKYSLKPTTGSVTTKGKWGKSSKDKLRSAKPDFSNSPLSIKKKPKENSNATRKSLQEEMTALKNKRANTSSAKLKKATASAKSSGKKTVSMGNKTYKVPAAKPTSLKGIESIVARKRKEDKYNNYVESIQRISAKRKKAAEKKKRPSSPDSKKNRRNREKKK